MTGVLLAATAVSAQPDQTVQLDSTNRVTLSLRFGLNISGRINGVGTGFNPYLPGTSPRRTPRGDAYNYVDGYVYPDISGSGDGQTWYWGYDSANQVNLAAHTLSLDQTMAAGASSGDMDTAVGFELAYDRQLGVKEDWHRLRYGVEAAVNFMPVSFKVAGTFNEDLVSTPYNFTALTTPPGYNQPGELPYQGSYEGPGFVLGSTPSGLSTTAVIPGARLLVQDKFDADLWGLRLGPYAEIPFGDEEKFTLRFSGGLAVGLLDASLNWNETFVPPGGGTSSTVAGGGSSFDLLWGIYFGADADYQITKRWGVSAGVEFQDLGTYNHSFGARGAQLDLSGSVFVKVGFSYSF